MSKIQILNYNGNSVDALRFMYDLLGVSSAISNRKIFTAVVRVFYPKAKVLLEGLGESILRDSQLLGVVLDFYAELLRQFASVDYSPA